jgi:hypothetical protein
MVQRSQLTGRSRSRTFGRIRLSTVEERLALLRELPIKVELITIDNT